MMQDKLKKINQKDLVDINGNYYIPESKANNLVDSRQFIPVYFAVTEKTEIHHDSPVMGVYEYGRTDRIVEGPFFDKSEAESLIQQAKKKVDHISYDFSSCVAIIPCPAEKMNEIQIRIDALKKSKIDLSSFSISALETILRGE
jgi:hypothetical protein